jgi:hypothetical protein
MESILFSLALLACPLGMGLMMWFMARGMRKDAPADQPPASGHEPHHQAHAERAGEQRE